MSSRVVRIDHEVWAELQRKAVAFEDNPNSVLRRLLGLGPSNLHDPVDTGAHESDSRVAKLLKLVEARVGRLPAVSPTKTNQSLRFRSRRGKIVAFIHPQNRRLKVESSEQMATAVGIKTWNHRLENGWWQQDNSVYWYVPNGEEDAYEQVSFVLDRLWKANPAAGR